jgi:hypothetical protein
LPLVKRLLQAKKAQKVIFEPFLLENKDLLMAAFKRLSSHKCPQQPNTLTLSQALFKTRV